MLPSKKTKVLDPTQLLKEMKTLELEAEKLHVDAQVLNKQGRYQESIEKYREYRHKDDDAISMALAIAETKNISTPKSFQPFRRMFSSMPLDQKTDIYQSRCIGSIVGAVVGDAAATSVQWVYDPEQLQLFSDRQLSQGLDGLDFMDPPANAHFEYEVGRNSPYGEQALVLLESLATEGCFDSLAYASLFAQRFGGKWHSTHNGYRDASCKGFLRNWALGSRPPLSGANDKQINCCVRLPPLLAAFDCDPELDVLLEQATRTTQNHDQAVAWAILGSRVLGAVLHGSEPRDAVYAAIQELWSIENSDSDEGQLSDALREECFMVAGYLHRALALSKWATVQRAVANLGKNCHTPNSYQTPVHAVLRVLESHRALLAEEELSEQHAQMIFSTCIRDAMREGGCCASRCGIIGGILGGYLAGKLNSSFGFIPPSWRKKSLAYNQAKDWAQTILANRAKSSQ